MIQRDCKREFIKNNYTDLKALNPGLPIYVRPADGVEPHIAARYGRLSSSGRMIDTSDYCTTSPNKASTNTLLMLLLG